ncbi:MAG TPA: hypothetical protein VE420_08095, partial [Gemmatimonadales bacterium]|nr:hypothetical protein [Gemmatimonadales bacterium]
MSRISGRAAVGSIALRTRLMEGRGWRTSESTSRIRRGYVYDVCGDLRRLQRDILPARITTREQAEILIALDRSIDRADKGWRTYLVATIRDFVVWGSPPAGRIDARPL